MNSVQYVAFLRGINVGGNAKASMKDLKKTFASLGFENVKTLLNSGNVVFGSEEKDQTILVQQIESKLRKTFGFPIKVFLRNSDQIKKIVSTDPFKKVAVTKETRLYVTFFSDREVFNVVDLASKTTTELMKNLEKNFGTHMTTRNWNTITRIAKL